MPRERKSCIVALGFVVELRRGVQGCTDRQCRSYRVYFVFNLQKNLSRHDGLLQRSVSCSGETPRFLSSEPRILSLKPLHPKPYSKSTALDVCRLALSIMVRFRFSSNQNGAFIRFRVGGLGPSITCYECHPGAEDVSAK